MSAKIESKIVDAVSETKSERSFYFSLFQDVRLLLIGLWLGAAVFFSFAVAPSLFAVLPTKDLAGAVVYVALRIINLSAFFIGIVLLLSAFPFHKGVKRISLAGETFSLLTLVVMSVIGMKINARIHEIRLDTGGAIDQLAQSDALRVAFNNLHGYSVIVLSVGMIAALVAFLLIARRRQP